MTKLYTPTPDGYCGDEDNGQTSAWYVFSALGFYPVAPATNQYVIGSPLFDKASLHLQNWNTFTITSARNDKNNPYIQGASLNNESFDNTWIATETIQNGGVLHFEMGPEPNMEWGISKTAIPYSLSNTKSLD